MTIRRQRNGTMATAGGKGFTLVELIAVLVLIGIVSAVALPRMMDRTPFDSIAYNDQVTGLLRYAQKMAVAQNRNVFVRINANGVALCYTAACGPGARVLAPGGANTNTATTRAACGDNTWACEAPPPNVTITPAIQFYFDAVGKPFNTGDTPPATVSSFTPLTISVRAAASVRTVTVEMETGYVH